MAVQIDVQPRGEGVGGLRDLGFEILQRDPAGVHDLVRIGGQRHVTGGISEKNINQFMFGQPVADLGTVFDLSAMGQREAGDPQFFGQAAGGAIGGRFVPIGMGAAGVRPETRRVILTERPALDQDLAVADHKDRHGQMTQTAQMGFQLFHRGQCAIHPCGDHDLEIISGVGHQKPDQERLPCQNQKGGDVQGELAARRLAATKTPIWLSIISTGGKLG